MNIFDLHSDTFYECLMSGKSLDDESLHINVADKIATEKWMQFFAVFIPDEYRGEQAKHFANTVLNCYNTQKLRFHEFFSDVPEAGKITPVLSVESAAALGGELSMIEHYKKLGVRMMTLTWNGENEVGFGQGIGGHLKPFGYDVIREMERLDMAVDVSHLSDDGFWDVMNFVKKPVCASHSNSRTVCNHGRNLTDEQFAAVRDNGGIVGLTLCSIFLAEGGSNDVSDIIKHARHFLELGGEDTLCIGTDFDGAHLPEGFGGARDLPKLYDMFISNGIPEDITGKIFYRNAAGFFGCLQ